MKLEYTYNDNEINKRIFIRIGLGIGIPIFIFFLLHLNFLISRHKIFL